MNESYNILMNLNSNPYNVRNYENSNEIQNRRNNIFNIVKTHNVLKKDKKLYRGFFNSQYYTYDGFAGNYTQAQALGKINQIENVVKNGWVYTLDTETMGQPKSFNPKMASDVDILNNNIFSVTEFSIVRQRYENGKAVGEAEKVLNFTSSHDALALRTYKSSAKSEKRYANNTTMQTLRRMAGYGNEGNYKDSEIIGWDGNAKITDERALSAGIDLLTKNAQYTVGSKEYNNKVKDIYKLLNDVISDDSSIITSMNGINFDNPVIIEMFEKAGIKIDENFKEGLYNKTVDTQQLIRGTLKDKVYQIQQKLRERGVDVSDSISVENLIHVAREMGADIDDIDAHVAMYDTINSAKIFDTLLPEFINARDTIVNDLERVPVSTQAIYHANSAVRANEGDLFFIDGGYDTPNTYNATLMESGHSYKLSSYSLNKNNKNNIPKELEGSIDDITGKKIIKMEDMYEGYNRTSYLVVNSQSDIQDKILNSGNVVVPKNTSEAIKYVNTSTEHALADKARQMRDSFYRVNSDNGFKSFEMYLNMFDDYTKSVKNPSKNSLKDAIKTGALTTYSGESVPIKDALSMIFSRGKDGTLIHERAFNLVNMYDDFESNFNLYTIMKKAVDEAVGDEESFYKTNNLSKGDLSKALYNRTKTSALASIKEEITGNVLNMISDEEILGHIVRSNDGLSEMVKSRTKLATETKGKQISKKDLDKIKRTAYKDYYNEDYDRNAKRVKSFVFGNSKASGTFKDFNGLDVLNPNGEFSRLQVNDRNNFASSFKKMLYGSIKAENGSAQASDNLRKIYLNKVAEDLHSRGIIGSDTLDVINSSDTVQSMADAITGSVYNTSKKFNKIVNVSKPLNLDKLKPEDKEFVKNYINNSKVDEIITDGEMFTVLGKPVKNFLKDKGMWFITPDGTDYNDNFKNIVNVGKRNIPNFTTFSTTATSKPENIEKMKNILKENFNWSDRNVDNFIDNVINNDHLKTFKYKTTGVETNGLSHSIVMQNGQGYLISTPFDKEKIVADKIARGANIDEINNLAVLWKIPTVENVGGVNVIRQGNVTMKAVTQDIVLRKNKKGVQVLGVEDTLDTVINSLGGRYGMRRAKELMEQGSYKGANKRVNSSWRKINSNKSLSSVSARYDSSTGEIFKEVVLNRADYALKDMVNISDLVYSMDVVTQNQELNKSFLESVGDVESKKIIKNVKEYKLGLRGSGKVKKKSFEEWDTSFKLWFADNISEIASEIINNKSFAEYEPEVLDILERLKTSGRKSFFGKESGDANKGYIFLTSPDKFVAGSSYSGVSRPLLNQVMSALNILPDDMVGLANKHHRVGSANINELTDKLGIKLGHGYITDTALDFIKTAKNDTKIPNVEIGFTAKMKFINSNDFIDTVNKYINVSDKDYSELLSNKNFTEALENFGMNTGDVNKDYIKRIAKNIASATNIYEDSSLISPLLGQVMAPKTITSIDAGAGASKLKVGDKLNPGSIISETDGIRYEKSKGTIVQIDGSKVYVQLNGEYNNFKGGIGGSEKTEFISPFVGNNKDDAVVADALIKGMFDGASAVSNPNVIKHESFNSMLSGYFNAVGYGIDDTNVDYINKSLKQYIPNAKLNYIKDERGRYILTEGDNIGSVSMTQFEDFFNNIKSTKEDTFKTMRDNIRNLEINNVGYFDIVTMQDNTVEGYQGTKDIGQGASISKRSQSVMGSFIGDENIEELSKYRSIENGAMKSLWQPLIDADVEELAQNKKFIKAQEQVQNIKVALSSSIGEPIDGAIIKNFDLNKGVVGSTIMEAETMPEIFKYTTGSDRVHAYAIDISDLNIDIDNFIYKDLETKGFLNTIKNSNLQEKVSTIYIPALDPNYMNEEYILTETQKKASDFINSINDFKNGKFETSIEEASLNIADKYKQLIQAYRHDLVDGDGLNERSQKIKSLLSSRMKMSKVAAPIVDDDGRYKDINFRNTSSLKVNGVDKYYASVFVSEGDFLNKGITFKDIGEQLIKDNIDNSDEALKIIKRNIKNVDGLNSAKDMATAKALLKKSGYKNKEVLENIGKDYLREIGIYGEIMRDPAFKTTSYQAVKIRIGDINQGTISIDAVTAKLINADVDGDEINLRFRGLKASGDKAKLRNADDSQVKALKNIMETNSNYNLGLFKAEVSNQIEKNKTTTSISEYIENMKVLGRDIENLDYYEGNTRYAGLLSRFLKSTIGQVSNPNYYLRAATNSYFARNPFSEDSYKGLASINAITDITEQSLIDTKSIKTLSNALNTAKLAGSYRQSMDDIASLKSDVKKKALAQMYRNLLTVTDTDTDGKGSIILGYDKKMLDENLEQAVEEAVQRILKGNVYKSNNGIQHTLEETLYYINKVLSDIQSRDIFFSSFIRQTDITSKGSNDKINEYEATKRAIVPEANPYDSLAKVTNSYAYLDSSVFLKGTALNAGDTIYATQRTGGLKEGQYTVSSLRHVGSKSNLELINDYTGESVTMTDNSFRDITNRLAGMNYASDGLNFEQLLTSKYTNDISSSLTGYSKVKTITSTTKSDNFYNKVATSALSNFNIDNVEDMYGTVEILKNKGLINESDASLFIKQMNDSVRNKGTKNYREEKMAKLLGLDSFVSNTKINSTGALKTFLDNEITSEGISSAISSAKYTSINETLKGLNRINIDNINVINNDAIDTIVKELAKKDLDVIKSLKTIFSENSEDLNFITDVLGLKIEEIDDLIKNNKSSEAIDIINSSKIAFGDFIGFDIGELTDDMLDAINTGNYDTSGISEEVVTRTSKIINKAKQLRDEGIKRTVKVPKNDVNDMVAEMIDAMNKGVKKKGSVGKSDKLNGKSILDKISEINSKAKGNKKLLVGTAAAAGAVLAGSYIYGNSKLNEEKKQYVKDNTNDYNGKVKQTEVGAQAGTKYKNVPNSNMEYYGSGEGLSMNISGKAPEGSNPSELNRMISRLFGGAGVSINTSVSDTRQRIEDRDVENIMTQAIK